MRTGPEDPILLTSLTGSTADRAYLEPTERSSHTRIVFILPNYGVGGAEKQLAALISNRPPYAKSIGIHTITLLPPTSAHVSELFAEAGAQNTLVDRSSMAFVPFLQALTRTIRRLNPSIVSTFLDSSVSTWGRLASLLAGVPKRVQSDRQLEPEGNWPHRILRPVLDRFTDRFTPNAHAIADRLIHSGVAKERIQVVPNGVDLHLFNTETVTSMRRDLGIPTDAIVLGFLGRFAQVKRLDLLLSAVQKLDYHDRPDTILLGGDGPLMAEIRALVNNDSWLSQHCIFLGTVDNTPAFLATIDYLVLASDSEGLPNVVLESMAMRKPVIATSVSDVPRMIGDSGLLVEPGNGAALAAKIAVMQNLDRAARQALGNLAHSRVKEHYSIESSARRFWDAHLGLVHPGWRGAETYGRDSG